MGRGSHRGRSPSPPPFVSPQDAAELREWERRGKASEEESRRYQNRILELESKLEIEQRRLQEQEQLNQNQLREAMRISRYEFELERARRESVAAMVRRYTVHMLKLGAGLSRLILEDMLNLFVQFAFSITYWDSLSSSTQIFTATSVVAGLILAVVSPMKDWLECRRARSDAVASGVDVDLALDDAPPVMDEEAALSESGLVTHPGIGQLPLLPHPGGDGSLGLDDISQPAHEEVPGSSSGSIIRPEGRRPIVLYRGSIIQFITEGTAAHSVVAHRLLLLSSAMYWGSTAALPFVFGDQIKGGAEAAIPQAAVLYFSAVTIASLLVELWIAARTEVGFHLLLDSAEIVKRALCHGRRKELMALFAILLSLLGRYDTFCDVIFVCVLWHTNPITELRFDSLNGYTLTLPCPLSHIAMFSLVVGIFGCQGVPGIVCLLAKTALPAAFKFNEFNFLLGIVEFQTK